MIELLLLVTAGAGFALLCLSLPRHQTEVLRRRLSPQRSRLLRGWGFAGLGLSYALALGALGFGRGTVTWTGLAAVAAATVVAGLMIQAGRSQASGGRRR
ncbi:MAG: DUF3325 domain-containing protein [Phenylobacterium sp.]|uniref:DUF3325 domain-containing protein n=1 Tax=Phenylobacterium sp. TaxID=1871053 RepID=UPI003918DA84